MHPRQPDTGIRCEVLQAAGSGVPVHPDAAHVAQDRSRSAPDDGAFDGTLHGRRERGQDNLPPLPSHFQHAVAVLLAQVGDVRPQASKIRRPSNPSMVTSAKPLRLAEVRAAVSRASNCRCDNPRVGDSGGTLGRRTKSAGDAASTDARWVYDGVT